MISAGDVEGAERVLRALLASEPAHARALQWLGDLRRRAGDPIAAARLTGRALRLVPGEPHALLDHGLALRELGRPGVASLAISAAVDRLPDDFRPRVGLALTLLDVGRAAEAALQLREAIRLAPGQPESHHLLASALYRLHLAGDGEAAVRHARAWNDAFPGHPIAAHSLASLTGDTRITHAAEDWVRMTFDRFGASFDHHLHALAYRVPDRIATLLGRIRRPSADADILDLGCGTGLCGPGLRPFARSLTGVDLSPGMLRQAGAKALYDELAEGELVAYLRGSGRQWDIVTAADVFIYIGDLAPAFAATAAALRPGGWFICSIEDSGCASGEAGFVLDASGRYRHHAGHIHRLAAAAGLVVRYDEAIPVRLERGVPLPGRLIAAVRHTAYPEAAI
ncbi:MAG TPA: methyltransferase domain-containing protein [Arenibaculum sp.]|nr:methyltransferase domain-containing protein [Arenibaculum sp.]